ncbi:hypothetical protein NQ318_019517 [Aromia moschata]|uniref:Dehydrogenase/reductase SDR family member 11 n=1 Tax=Aromia moschata TaxID=1265417 RepID=A0AAV8Y0C4_9CUCU|nr:hypothetical protein NQ318_019517 [Aromia moschata]
MVLSFDRWVGKVAIVTGASSGIGAAITEQLVEKGLKCINPIFFCCIRLSLSHAEKIDSINSHRSGTGRRANCTPLETDVSKEEDILNAFKWVKDNLGPVHILINNAGILKKGSLGEGDSKIWENIFKVNVLGLCIATREAVKDMKANNIDGHIIQINSIAGHQIPSYPGLNVYPASKYAVTALAETLRLELNSAKSKIKITSISPGAVSTEIVSGNEDFKKILENLVKEKQILDAEDIADSVIYALSTPPHVQIQELTIRPVIEPLG